MLITNNPLERVLLSKMREVDMHYSIIAISRCRMLFDDICYCYLIHAEVRLKSNMNNRDDFNADVLTYLADSVKFDIIQDKISLINLGDVRFQDFYVKYAVDKEDFDKINIYKERNK